MNLGLKKFLLRPIFRKKKEELLVTESHKLFAFWIMEKEIGFVGHA